MYQAERDSIYSNSPGLEYGDIYFFYQPKGAEAHGIEDVERLFLVLHPIARKEYRLFSLDAARFPQPGETMGTVTGRVESVEKNSFLLQEELKERRVQLGGGMLGLRGSARPCGEGVYSLLERGGETHLAFVLELPAEGGPVQEQIGLRGEGSFVLGIYNPEFENVDEQGAAHPSVRFPDPLQTRFGTGRVLREGLLELLGFPGAQVSFSPGVGSVIRDLELDLAPEWEDRETAEVFRDLKLERERFPVEPLVSGTWR